MPLRYRVVKPSLCLQGLLIVLALLGHDLLMASHAPAAAMAPVMDVLHAHSATQPMVDLMTALSQSHPESPHPSVCGTGGTALFQPVDQPGTPDFNPATAIGPSQFPTSAHGRTL